MNDNEKQLAYEIIRKEVKTLYDLLNQKDVESPEWCEKATEAMSTLTAAWLSSLLVYKVGMGDEEAIKEIRKMLHTCGISDEQIDKAIAMNQQPIKEMQELFKPKEEDDDESDSFCFPV